MGSPYKTFASYTFGCKVNFADSSSISRQLVDLGFMTVHINDIADIYVINTCSVTALADKKAQKLIKKLNTRAPNSKIIVTGCYAQLKPNEIKNIPGVDYVVGAENKLNVRSYFIENNNNNSINVSKINSVNTFDISYSLNERTRAFLKIQDGCDYICTYCTIPRARGKSRSDNIDNTVIKIKDILQHGVKEIVLSGINLGDFGINKNENFLMLLKNIEQIKNLSRYRISSIEPNLINSDIIKLLSNSCKVARHLHIPLQSGSNNILKEMKRRYTIEYYEKTINRIKKLIPNICIGVDVIVGFPGEKEDDFEKTIKLLKKLKVSYLHVFSYSERDNTEAKKYNQNNTLEIVKERRKILQKPSIKLFKDFVNENINNKLNVLFEKYENGYLSGLTDNYIKVYVKDKQYYMKKIKQVKIISNEELTLGMICD